MKANKIGERYKNSSDILAAELELMRQGKHLILELDRPGSKLEHFGYAMSGGLYAGELTILAGPPGNGKSYLTFLLGCMALQQDVPWIYLPIEDTHIDWLKRCCGVRYNNWSWLGKKQVDIRYVDKMMETEEATINHLGHHIADNPRRAYLDENGKVQVPKVDFHEVCEWVGDTVEDERLIIIDPISMIEFKDGKRQTFEGQSELVQKCQGIAKLKRCHIILVCHTEKRPGSVRRLGLPDVQGAADVTRFAHNVILMDYHLPREDEVLTMTNERNMGVEHKRTLILAKSREGSLSNAAIAMDFHKDGPEFQELGFIQEPK